MMENEQALIIGCGISGIVCARILAEHGYKVTILEKRNHIGGNAYDYYEDGILVHKYGPHLFHTKMDDVAAFMEKYDTFFPYEHRVLAEIEGKLVPVPFNYKSIDILFSREKAEYLKQILSNQYKENENVPILKLRENKNEQIRDLAEYVFKNIFVGYSQKQWGIPIEKMNEDVLGRVPVRTGYDNRYFTDVFQKMPVHGYTALFERMLAHQNIALRLNCDAFNVCSFRDGTIVFDGNNFTGPVVYTGSIDALFCNVYGRLPYRSLEFVSERRNVKQVQPVVQVNYPNEYSYTRISEFALLQKNKKIKQTILLYEYPKECGINDIPYYPVESTENRIMYEKYLHKALSFTNLHLLGRLAEYKYYNMDQTIKHALDMASDIIGINK